MSVISHSVIVTVVSPFHVSPFRYSMCRRFGYMCVAVLVCRRFDQLPAQTAMCIAVWALVPVYQMINTTLM